MTDVIMSADCQQFYEITFVYIIWYTLVILFLEDQKMSVQQN